LCLPGKQKVPRPYSGAEDDAPSLTGARDDDLFDKEVIGPSTRFKLYHYPRFSRFDPKYQWNRRPDVLRFMRQLMAATSSDHIGKGEPDVLHYSFQAHTV
jgi:hypothetical protein